MSATLRGTVIQRRRKRQEKRRKLRLLLARASGAERPGLEAKLQKTYPFGSPERTAHAPSGAPRK